MSGPSAQSATPALLKRWSPRRLYKSLVYYQYWIRCLWRIVIIRLNESAYYSRGIDVLSTLRDGYMSKSYLLGQDLLGQNLPSQNFLCQILSPICPISNFWTQIPRNGCQEIIPKVIIPNAKISNDILPNVTYNGSLN